MAQLLFSKSLVVPWRPLRVQRLKELKKTAPFSSWTSLSLPCHFVYFLWNVRQRFNFLWSNWMHTGIHWQQYDPSLFTTLKESLMFLITPNNHGSSMWPEESMIRPLYFTFLEMIYISWQVAWSGNLCGFEKSIQLFNRYFICPSRPNEIISLWFKSCLQPVETPWDLFLKGRYCVS